ncbi:hypothetical protein Fot_22196 [Forsythia ovata]|uniref:Uncharacterized protein n=1 Tax=Forsythia ovata TaxID=205694 RepID=A0ABD1UYQ1_9LAMI
MGTQQHITKIKLLTSQPNMNTRRHSKNFMSPMISICLKSLKNVQSNIGVYSIVKDDKIKVISNVHRFYNARLVRLMHFDKHTCALVFENTSANSGYFAKECMDSFRIDPIWTLENLLAKLD